MFVRMDCDLCNKLRPIIDDIYDLKIGLDPDSIVSCLLTHALDDLCIILEFHEVK